MKKATLIVASVLALSTACQRGNTGPNDRNDNRNRSGAYDQRNNQDPRCGQQGGCGVQGNDYARDPNHRDNRDANYNNGNPNNNNNSNNNMSQEENDWQITNNVKETLMNDNNLATSGRYVNVETNNRVVTLTGNVPTKEDSKYIESKVKSVKGVSRVNNELTIAPNS